MKYYIITITDVEGFKTFYSRRTLKMAKFKWEIEKMENPRKEVTLIEIKERKIKCVS